MAAVLRLKLPDGSWYEVPALRGTTAYESAQLGGYTGTEQQFYADLAAVGVVGAHRYGIRWSKALKTCERLYDAKEYENLSITNFCHKGSINANYNNPFDNLYPWKYRRVVNTDLSKYARYREGDPGVPTLESCILAEVGDSTFTVSDETKPVDVYTPEFWYRFEDHDTYWDLIIADGPLPSYQYAPETLGGRWFGKYTSDGTKCLSIAGIPECHVSFANLHTKCKGNDMTCEDAWTWCYDTMLQYVEYACLNTQTNVGSGDSVSYRQSSDQPTANSTGVVISAPAAFVNACVVGLQVDIGTSSGDSNVGKRYVVSKDTTSNTITVNEDITVTTAHFLSLHGMINETDSLLLLNSASGYIGTDGKAHAYYRGRVSHAGRWRYLLGLYREGGTDKFYTAKDQASADAVDSLSALKTNDAARDTGYALPGAGSNAAGGGYVSQLGFIVGLPFIALCTSTTGGSSNAPLGDYYYWPASTTGDTICGFGGDANSGARAGRSSLSWNSSSSDSAWVCVVLPFYKSL